MVGNEIIWVGGKREALPITLALDFGLNPVLGYADAEKSSSVQFSEKCRFIPLKSSFSSTLLYDFLHSFSVNYFNSL